ncbi:MAG: hypothetical protein LLG04_18350 [Parachlamydia sp.]|nr:hypothetical protein [Parachlamydia sp.]
MATEGIGPTIKAVIKDAGTVAAKPFKSAAKESLGLVAKLRQGTSLGKLGNRIGTIAENLERKFEPSPQTHLKEHINKLTEQLYRAISSKFNIALVSLKIKQPETSQTIQVLQEVPVEKQKIHFATTEAESKERFEQFSKDYAEHFPSHLTSQDTLSLTKTFVELEKEPKLETRMDKIKAWMNEKNVAQSDQTKLYNALEMFWKTEPPTLPQAKVAPPKQEAITPKPPSTTSPRKVARQAASEPSPVIAAPTSEARKKAILAAMKPTRAAQEANAVANAFYKNTQIGADLSKAVENSSLTREEADLIRQIYMTESARNQSDEAKAAAIKKIIAERIKTEKDSEKELTLNELIGNIDTYLEHSDFMPPPPNQT